MISALPDDREQPVEIDADSNEFLMEEGTAIYYGSESEPATITQGSLKISGLKIVFEQDEAGNPSSMTATGNPARLQQQPEVNGSIVHASGDTIHYEHASQVVTLEGNAELRQDTSLLQGDFVEYDMLNKRSRATARNEGGRINMTIQPEAAEISEQSENAVTEEPATEETAE